MRIFSSSRHGEFLLAAMLGFWPHLLIGTTTPRSRSPIVIRNPEHPQPSSPRPPPPPPGPSARSPVRRSVHTLPASCARSHRSPDRSGFAVPHRAPSSGSAYLYSDLRRRLPTPPAP